MPQKRWQIPPIVTPQADENLAAFSPIMRQLLFNRGYATDVEARAFLAAESQSETDPLQLSGMASVIERIQFARDHHESIAIYGDYDVDGVTATALLVETLQRLGASVQPYIPNRFDEGYGLNSEALDGLKANGVRLVITVDCGIRSPDEALHAREIGLDLIISDHHQSADGPLPSALAVINPKQPGDLYPDKNLAGVGVAYKIAQALLAPRPARFRVEAFLDLVALGTVADLAPLIEENRMLVRRGLEEIRQTRRQGLFSLARVAGLAIGKTTSTQIGFILGPRLNAAGRLDSALATLELLTTADAVRGGQLAQRLEAQNRQRQVLTRETQEKAELLATAQDKNPFLLFAADDQFNPGVVGLAASRLSETYYRPAIVAAKGSDQTRGSCRSIPEFHITEALDQCSDLLIRHGGHAAAAGFTVQNDNLPELINRLRSLAEAQLGGLNLRPTVGADMELSLASVSFELLRELADLEPTGYGNREGAFISRDVKLKSSRTVGADGGHLKLTLEDEHGVTLDAIGFRLGRLQASLPKHLDIAYTIESNEYNGRTSIQLNLKDLKETGVAD